MDVSSNPFEPDTGLAPGRRSSRRLPEEAGPAQSARRISSATQWRLFFAALVLNDTLMVLLAFFVAGWARFNLSLPIFNLEARPTIPEGWAVLLILAPAWIAIFALEGLYRRRNLLGGLKEYSLIFRATTIGLLLIVISGFLSPEARPARGWVLLAWVFTFVLVSVGRFTLRRIAYALRRHGYFLSPTIIIGANQEGHSLARQLQQWRTSGLAVIGFVDNDTLPGTPVADGLTVLGPLSDLEQLVAERDVEELILATSAIPTADIWSVFRRFGLDGRTSVRMSSGLFEVINTGLEVKEIASVPLVRINHLRLTGFDALLKTTLDLLLGLPLAVLSLPLMLILAVLIRLDSPGPVFYKRRVLGVNGKPFDAYKFRTMVVDGDALLDGRPELLAELAANQKLKDDPRVTRAGRSLRRSSLDELPQLLNVLKRQMSLVGPRMITPEELKRYDTLDANLLTVRPGLTGLWQISGRSDLSYEERIQYDMRYIRNWSLWLDLHILMRTLAVVMRREGAY
jgi:exopolysaccharide biosynthesis polyprenyl glycosylphosphotransferase